MLKNPIPKVTNILQYRAIGIVNGKYIPHSIEKINRGVITDNKGEKIETVVLGKALSLLKKHIDLEKSYIWDPYQLNDFSNDSSKVNFPKLLEELDLKDNYFSVRGELVFVNTKKKEIVIKICSALRIHNLKNKNFKLIIKGELSLELLNSFLSLDVLRDGNSLKLFKYEVIQKKLK